MNHLISDIEEHYILHPEYEDQVLHMDHSPRMKMLIAQWHKHNEYRKVRDTYISNLSIPISFSLYLMSVRIRMVQEGYEFLNQYRKSIYSQETFKELSYPTVPSEKASLLFCGFITDKNIKYICNDDRDILYRIPIDEAILATEEMLFDLIDLDEFKYEDLYIFFYHDHRERYTYLGDDIYLLHRFSTWNSYNGGGSVSVLKDDRLAIVAKEGWTEKDYNIMYPGYIILYSEDDLEDDADASYVVQENNEYSFDDMIISRPYIYVSVHAGVALGEYMYTPKTLYMIMFEKLPPLWQGQWKLYECINQDISSYRDGMYYNDVQITMDFILTADSYYIHQGTNERRSFWYLEETLFTLCDKSIHKGDIVIETR